MKILVAADIHYSLKQYDWLLAVAGGFDLVVIAGDLLEISSSVDRRAQVVVVKTYLEQIAEKTRVAVCSGNHDLDTIDGNGEQVADWMRDLDDLGVASDSTTIRMGQTLITICPWWDGPDTREAIAEQLVAAAAQPRDRWIWVYHAPPSESPVSWGGKRSFGDTELLQWIARFHPDIVVSGHVHQSPFVTGGSWADRIDGTWVFNTGQQIGEVPAHIIFDMETCTALWFSIYGNEVLDLEAPLERPIQPLRALPDWLRA
ncbi:MAG: phosphohydrolase [Cereibacter sphaeroides]|uniref:Phosphohydrolase n=1 Tax=Cereibacter sphaeroides TaxID=1063 RepID=A0A2W5SAY3_CERSP|nr:MAG: phosphohydrolase [Cereibacter sphaeroides]